jgi:hypothetical protein
VPQSAKSASRSVIDGYRETIREVVSRVTRKSLPIALGLAARTELLGGYEEIKLSNVNTYEARHAALLEASTAPTPREREAPTIRDPGGSRAWT